MDNIYKSRYQPFEGQIYAEDIGGIPYPQRVHNIHRLLSSVAFDVIKVVHINNSKLLDASLDLEFFNYITSNKLVLQQSTKYGTILYKIDNQELAIEYAQLINQEDRQLSIGTDVNKVTLKNVYKYRYGSQLPLRMNRYPNIYRKSVKVDLYGQIIQVINGDRHLAYDELPVIDSKFFAFVESNFGIKYMEPLYGGVIAYKDYKSAVVFNAYINGELEWDNLYLYYILLGYNKIETITMVFESLLRSRVGDEEMESKYLNTFRDMIANIETQYKKFKDLELKILFEYQDKGVRSYNSIHDYYQS